MNKLFLLSVLFIVTLPLIFAQNTGSANGQTLQVWDSSDSQQVTTNLVEIYAEYSGTGTCTFSHDSSGSFDVEQDMLIVSNQYRLTADGNYNPGHIWHLPKGEYNIRVTCNGLSVIDDISVQDYSHEIAYEFSQIPPETDRQIVYDMFNEFSKAHFGAELEELTYTYAKTYVLSVLPESVWTHTSENSFFVGWETNLPAIGYVEYGTTTSYGQRTQDDERIFFIHNHHVTSLQQDTTYHYRIVSIDERGNRVFGPDRTFTTTTIPNAIHLQSTGERLTLSQDDAYYILDEDIISLDVGIEIAAQGITLDLNGHSIIYGEGTRENGYGIRRSGSSNDRPITIVNGKISQGENPAMYTNADSNNFGAILIGNGNENGDFTLEIAGVDIEYYASQMWGLRFTNAKSDYDIHHNTINDLGVLVTDRHGAGTRSMGFSASQPNTITVHHNLIKRTRQSGINTAKYVYNNELYIDSWTANSFGIQSYSDLEGGGIIEKNKIFATGYYAIAIPWSVENESFNDNFIHMEGINTGLIRWTDDQWGEINIVIGFRLTQYDSGGQYRNKHDYHDNILVLKGKDGSTIRGTGFYSDTTNYNFTMRNSIIKAEFLDDQTSKSGAIATEGHWEKPDSVPLLYINVTTMSNVCNIRFGDSYGKGHNHYFINNTFVKFGDDPRYHTFIFDGSYYSYGHVIRDPVFEGGAAYDDVFWDSGASRIDNYRVEWTLSLTSSPNAQVIILDKNGFEEFRGTTNAQGLLNLPLIQTTIRTTSWSPTENWGPFDRNSHTKYNSTPHTVVVVNEQGTQSNYQTIAMDQKKSLTLLPAQSVNTPPEIILDEYVNITLPRLLSVEGVYYDADEVSVSWEKMSGYDSVTFTNPNSAVTEVGFPRAGNYLLRFSVDDGTFVSSKDILVEVFPSDLSAPSIASASTFIEYDEVFVEFSEQVDSSSAQNMNNYDIPSLSIYGASLNSDNKTVTLTVSEMTSGQSYTLTVNNVQDRAYNPNTIITNSQTSFTFTGVIKVNFQPSSAEIPQGYTPDIGAPYTGSGELYSFGWSQDNSELTRDRNHALSPDQRYDTIYHMSHTSLGLPAYWNMYIPNGEYEVHVVSGDPTYVDSAYHLSVEGTLVDFVIDPSFPWDEQTVTVLVQDGTLTIDNAPGTTGNKINFVDIQRVGNWLPGDLNRDDSVNLQDLFSAHTLSELLLVGRNLF